MTAKLQQAGDTIVEVLIVIAVLSLVLTAAFLTSTASFKNTIDAKEHGEAQALASSQLEKVKALAVSNPTSVFTSADFCVDITTTTPSVYAASDARCIMKSDGTPAPSGFEPAFTVTVHPTTSGGSNPSYVFKANVNWDSITGHGKADLALWYRLYSSS